MAALQNVSLTDVIVGSFIDCCKILVPNNVFVEVPRRKRGSDSTKIWAGKPVRKLALVLKVESNHLVVCVITTMNSAENLEETVKDTTDWYPLAPSPANGNHQPLPVENTNRAGYILLRHLTYYPDDPDNNVLVRDRSLLQVSLDLVEAALPNNIISGKAE